MQHIEPLIEEVVFFLQNLIETHHTIDTNDILVEKLTKNYLCWKYGGVMDDYCKYPNLLDPVILYQKPSFRKNKQLLDVKNEKNKKSKLDCDHNKHYSQEFLKNIVRQVVLSEIIPYIVSPNYIFNNKIFELTNNKKFLGYQINYINLIINDSEKIIKSYKTPNNNVCSSYFIQECYDIKYEIYQLQEWCNSYNSSYTITYSNEDFLFLYNLHKYCNGNNIILNHQLLNTLNHKLLDAFRLFRYLICFTFIFISIFIFHKKFFYKKQTKSKIEINLNNQIQYETYVLNKKPYIKHIKLKYYDGPLKLYSWSCTNEKQINFQDINNFNDEIRIMNRLELNQINLYDVHKIDVLVFTLAKEITEYEPTFAIINKMFLIDHINFNNDIKLNIIWFLICYFYVYRLDNKQIMNSLY